MRYIALLLVVFMCSPCFAYEYDDMTDIFDDTEAEDIRLQNEYEMQRQQEHMDRLQELRRLYELQRIYDNSGPGKNIY